MSGADGSTELGRSQISKSDINIKLTQKPLKHIFSARTWDTCFEKPAPILSLAELDLYFTQILPGLRSSGWTSMQISTLRLLSQLPGHWFSLSWLASFS